MRAHIRNSMNSYYPNFNTLKKKSKSVNTDLPEVRIAILADSAVQFLTIAIKGAFAEKGYYANIFEADVDQIAMQLLSPTAELNDFKPEYIVVFEALPQIKKRFYKIANRSKFHQNEIVRIKEYIGASSHKQARLLYFNHLEVGDNIYGHYSAKLNYSLEFQLKKLNIGLMELSQEDSNFKLFDFNGLASAIGYENSIDKNITVQTDLQIGLDFLPQIAYQVSAQILAEKGNFKKCLILDLDNTTWGGIIGDDGLERIQIGGLGIGKAFTELQRWALELKNRGIILAVASKNTEHIAKEPFEKHPDMVLRLDDIAVFMANWDNKVMNIQKIQSILNIGFDSMVFLDDNPFERGMVQENLPQVTVPDLPEDPVEYMSFLRSLSLFETAGLSEADSKRTVQYQTEAKRQAERELFEDDGTYLKNLNMQARVEELTDFNLPRIAQLTQRSNQFNLRTERFTESELRKWNAISGNSTLAIYLSDKYGDHGLIAILMLEENDASYFIKNWIMSCRVLKRDVEKFSLNLLISKAKEDGKKNLIGEYLSTPKNDLVSSHYQNLGFEKHTDTEWFLSTADYKMLDNYIELIK